MMIAMCANAARCDTDCVVANTQSKIERAAGPRRKQ